MRKQKKARKSTRRRISTTAKSALFFGITAAVLIAVLLAPSPKDGKNSGIELYGDDPQAEIYGPELPQSTVGSYPVPIVESPILEDSGETKEVTYVYASDDQDCYHLSTCKFAFASGHKFTVEEAKLLKYKPCGRCNPPS